MKLTLPISAVTLLVSADGLLTATRQGDRWTMDGGQYGAHAITTEDPRRLWEHWAGYCENNGSHPAFVGTNEPSEAADAFAGASKYSSGQRVRVKVNGLGSGVVLAHSVHTGFNGFLARLDAAPEWFVRQNGSADCVCWLTPNELEAL